MMEIPASIPSVLPFDLLTAGAFRTGILTVTVILILLLAARVLVSASGISHYKSLVRSFDFLILPLLLVFYLTLLLNLI